MHEIPEVLLASASMRRVEMLSWITDRFDTMPADIDESPMENELPIDYCKRIANEKAIATLKIFPYENIPIITADTTVYLGSEIIGKPRDAAHAREILGKLSGRSHHVCTALVLCSKYTDQKSEIRMISTLCDTLVHMNPLSEKTIQDYVATGDPMGKAGAYAIQNRSFNLIHSIQGCYSCVVGFPLCHLERLFSIHGIPLKMDAAACCKAHISNDCKINKDSLLKESVFSQKYLELA